MGRLTRFVAQRQEPEERTAKQAAQQRKALRTQVGLCTCAQNTLWRSESVAARWEACDS